MTIFKTIALLTVLAVSSALAQTVTTPDTLPANFAAAGLGFQKTASPQTSGWATVCHANPTVQLWGMALPSYSCASTDYTGSVTSARADIATVLLQRGGFVAGTKTGAGVSTTANNIGGTNVGAAYDLGGWASLDISGLTKMPGLRLVTSISWLKQDISGITGQPPVTLLRDLAEHAAFRFGFGKTW